MISKVDEYIKNAVQWREELLYLRSIALQCNLSEEIKWNQPCYTYSGKNIAIISSFKRHAFISFFKGSFLTDTKSILVAPGENSHSARLIPFTQKTQIMVLEKTIKEYILEAIEIETLGLEVKNSDISEHDIPDELINKFNNSPDFKRAFKLLTPGRQRGYLLYFSQAKQSSTRATRIDKYAERILNGKGMRDCICGHSKQMPNCDGSHKQFS